MFFGTRTMPSTDSYWDKLDRLSEAFAAADAVLIGRPFVNMVYGGGAEGVQVYVDKLKAELADTMAMCGAHCLADIKRSMIFGY